MRTSPAPTKNRLFLIELGLAVFAATPAMVVAARKQADPSTVVKLSVNLPSMAPLPETQQSQDKGGLKITVAPVSYSIREEQTGSARRVNPNFKEGLLLIHGQGDVFVERQAKPVLTVAPDRLRFQIHISNQMSRVFRGSGMAVQFNVAGKVQAINPSAYADLVNIIVPPRGEQDIEVIGPELS